MKLITFTSFLFLLTTSALAHYPTFDWKPYYGRIPFTAVEGGFEQNRNLYICRAEFHGGLHPGKVVNGKCNIGWGGKEVTLDSFDVLVKSRYRHWPYTENYNDGQYHDRWHDGNRHNSDRYNSDHHNNSRPNNDGSNQERHGGNNHHRDKNQPQTFSSHWQPYRGYIPRSAVRGGWEPNRSLYICRGWYNEGLHPGKVVDGKCNIGWGGRERILRNFDILTR